MDARNVKSIKIIVALTNLIKNQYVFSVHFNAQNVGIINNNYYANSVMMGIIWVTTCALNVVLTVKHVSNLVHVFHVPS